MNEAPKSSSHNEPCAPKGPFHLNEYLVNRGLRRPGGGRVVVQHRQVRRASRDLRHP